MEHFSGNRRGVRAQVLENLLGRKEFCLVQTVFVLRRDNEFLKFLRSIATLDDCCQLRTFQLKDEHLASDAKDFDVVRNAVGALLGSFGKFTNGGSGTVRDLIENIDNDPLTNQVRGSLDRKEVGAGEHPLGFRHGSLDGQKALAIRDKNYIASANGPRPRVFGGHRASLYFGSSLLPNCLDANRAKRMYPKAQHQQSFDRGCL